MAGEVGWREQPTWRLAGESGLPEGWLVAAGLGDEGAVGGAEAWEGRARHAVGLVGGGGE